MTLAPGAAGCYEASRTKSQVKWQCRKRQLYDLVTFVPGLADHLLPEKVFRHAADFLAGQVARAAYPLVQQPRPVAVERHLLPNQLILAGNQLELQVFLRVGADNAVRPLRLRISSGATNSSLPPAIRSTSSNIFASMEPLSLAWSRNRASLWP